MRRAHRGIENICFRRHVRVGHNQLSKRTLNLENKKDQVAGAEEDQEKDEHHGHFENI